ncbi:hypothetical protein BHM03_00033047 [Ensete ventricosum]|nr:hypothetical protein BHM03_00033047 [Ensete ventricosum]
MIDESAWLGFVRVHRLALVNREEVGSSREIDGVRSGVQLGDRSRRDQMGRWLRTPLLLGLLLAVVVAGLVNLSDGGVTSSFVRKAKKAIDMPIDSDVFRLPPGYNAPQQVAAFLLCG